MKKAGGLYARVGSNPTPSDIKYEIEIVWTAIIFYANSRNFNPITKAKPNRKSVNEIIYFLMFSSL